MNSLFQFFINLYFFSFRYQENRPDNVISSKCTNEITVGKKSIRALEIFRVQKLILNATS